MDSSNLDLVVIISQSGPVVKGVLVLLVLASVVSWGIIFNKWKMMKNMKKINEEFIDIYQKSGTLKEIMYKSEHLSFSPYKIMFKEGFDELVKITQSEDGDAGDHFKNFGLQSIERSLQKGAGKAKIQLDNLLSTLASIGSISPFVGLFGTVWGIINSFRGLASGGADLTAVAPGIAEALVATAIGLAAAIPAVWFYNHFTSENSKFSSEMENFGQDFLNLIERSIKRPVVE
jgi:biopolymer transport protein TolQ